MENNVLIKTGNFAHYKHEGETDVAFRDWHMYEFAALTFVVKIVSVIFCGRPAEAAQRSLSRIEL